MFSPLVLRKQVIERISSRLSTLLPVIDVSEESCIAVVETPALHVIPTALLLLPLRISGDGGCKVTAGISIAAYE